jgi:hypothetical protein
MCRRNDAGHVASNGAKSGGAEESYKHFLPPEETYPHNEIKKSVGSGSIYICPKLNTLVYSKAEPCITSGGEAVMIVSLKQVEGFSTVQMCDP